MAKFWCVCGQRASNKGTFKEGFEVHRHYHCPCGRRFVTVEKFERDILSKKEIAKRAKESKNRQKTE